MAVLMATGCASTKMQDAGSQAVVVPANDMAQVIFMRPSSFGGAIQASLFNATGDDLDFIGILSSKKKIAYTVPAGKHRFMVVSEAADFLEANLDGGKTYYALVSARMGAWKARFSIFPIKAAASADYVLGDEKTQKWISDTTFVENTEQSIAWFEENRGSIASKQAKYLPVWSEKTPEALAERTLDPEDGS